MELFHVAVDGFYKPWNTETQFASKSISRTFNMGMQY